VEGRKEGRGGEKATDLRGDIGPPSPMSS
jgi:hypothetical protein